MVRQAGAKIGHRPGEQQVKADLGQIGVTVGPGQLAGLHEADDRDEHAQIPQPADEEPRPSFPQGIGGGRNGEEQDEREGGFPQRQGVSGMRIKDGKAGGVEHLADVVGIGHEGIADAREQGHSLGTNDRLMVGTELDDRSQCG